MRRLIFCFDGSWNKLDTKKHPTNVVLVAESILPIDADGVQQIVYYDEGVGTASDETWRGGIFGKGLVQNIRDAYRFLIFNYLPDDEIFVFGFSRGAFTARSFIGFIRMAGIIVVNDASQIGEAWALYRKFASRADEDIGEVLEFRSKHCPQLCISTGERDWRLKNAPGSDGQAPILRIRYCGVWDTVGTLGFKAVTAIFDRSTDKRYSWHDTELSSTVEAGRHAVAIDERRVHFMPTLWRNVRKLNEDAGKSSYDADAPFQQKWFAGDHGSVGGGGPDRRLSNAALHWVLKGAVNKGLKVRLDGRSQLKNIRYDARGALKNTPDEGVTVSSAGRLVVDRVLSGLKSALLSASRAGPAEISDVHPSALRRWFVPGPELPEGHDYRPKPLLRLTKQMDALRSTYLPADEPGTRGVRLHMVKEGDTLSRIAQDEAGGASKAKTIFALNRNVIDDIDDIFPDDVLRLPTE